MSESPEPRILVVDDDQAIRDLLCAVLRRRSHRVDAASNGEEGLERLRETRYAIVLLDLMMPRVNGHAFLERLRALELDSRPIVLVISAGDESDLRKLDRGTVSAIVRKPFDIFELADLVTACIGPHAGELEDRPTNPAYVARLPIADAPAADETTGLAAPLSTDDSLIVPRKEPEK